MPGKIHFFLLLLFFAIHAPLAVTAQIVASQTHPSATVHQLAGVESTAVIPPWKWHTKETADAVFVSGKNKTLVQSRVGFNLGFGLPGELEIHIGLPIGYTFNTFEGNGKTGVGTGDLRVGFLHQIKGAQNGGFGVLAGVLGYIPVGKHAVALGEGHFALQPFISVSLTSFSTSLTLNLGYHFRSEHRIIDGQNLEIEQDDDLLWRVALRIPKDEDIAWSLIINGTIGVATKAGLWPDKKHRPLWVGGAIDFPGIRDRRMGIFCSFLTGEASRGIYFGVQFSGVAKDRDEDRDGVLIRWDKCPFLREDSDGFQDADGCPDLDNDMDSFPDTEDACPLKKGDDFSMDGC